MASLNCNFIILRLKKSQTKRLLFYSTKINLTSYHNNTEDLIDSCRFIKFNNNNNNNNKQNVSIKLNFSSHN